eukprot:COSAG02_NODE_181_length_30783_cov_53.060520_15_plen_124_part_00
MGACAGAVSVGAVGVGASAGVAASVVAVCVDGARKLRFTLVIVTVAVTVTLYKAYAAKQERGPQGGSLCRGRVVQGACNAVWATDQGPCPGCGIHLARCWALGSQQLTRGKGLLPRVTLGILC